MKIRYKKNTYNLGFWIVKDIQNKITLNLGYYRIQL